MFTPQQTPKEVNSSGILGGSTTSPHKRLDRELKSFAVDSRDALGIRLNTDKMESMGDGRLDMWFVDIVGPQDTLYAGEQFQLQFKFGTKYPFECPEVIFIGSNIPIHPHVYSNGHICVSLLSDDWSPATTVLGICLSLQSMLAASTEKKRPHDNEDYVRDKSVKSPKDTKWHFDDDGI